MFFSNISQKWPTSTDHWSTSQVSLRLDLIFIYEFLLCYLVRKNKTKEKGKTFRNPFENFPQDIYLFLTLIILVST